MTVLSSRRDSNPQPADYKSAALPIAPREHVAPLCRPCQPEGRGVVRVITQPPALIALLCRLPCWCTRRESNPRAAGYEPVALPTELLVQVLRRLRAGAIKLSALVHMRGGRVGPPLERVTGLEPALPAWKAGALPTELHPHKVNDQPPFTAIPTCSSMEIAEGSARRPHDRDARAFSAEGWRCSPAASGS